jgi:hypothetical protein
MINYLILGGTIYALSVIPAFGPPSWTALVILHLELHLAVLPSVLVGAVSTTAGRATLAIVTRMIRDHLSETRRRHLTAVSEALRRRKASAIAGVGLFLVSPLPSAQLWEGAGLLKLPLLPLATAFVCGRIFTFSLYLSVAHVAERSLQALLTNQLTSPVAIAMNVVLVLALLAVGRINWIEVLDHRRTK